MLNTPIHLNRPFSKAVLNDWWAWQQHRSHIFIPPIWVRDQNCLDLWFHMFSLAHSTSPDYLQRLVHACVDHQQWDFTDMCASLMYWDQHRNFLADTQLMPLLLEHFANVHPEFCRAVAVSTLTRGAAHKEHVHVLLYAMQQWNSSHALARDGLLWEASWDYFKRSPSSNNSAALIDFLAQHFSLRDFLVLALPSFSASRLSEGELSAFKTTHGLLRLFEVYDAQGLVPTLEALKAVRVWPVAKITAEDLNVLGHVEQHLHRHPHWSTTSPAQWFLADWLTQLRLRSALDGSEGNGDNKGRRKI